MTSWAKARLTELLQGVRCTLPEGMGVVETTKVKDLEGDAQITMIRQKTKYLFDFSFKLAWKVDLRDVGPCKGTLTYPDVTPDCEGDYETLYEVDRDTPPRARGVLEAFVRNSTQGLQPEISRVLEQFKAEYMATKKD